MKEIIEYLKRTGIVGVCFEIGFGLFILVSFVRCALVG